MKVKYGVITIRSGLMLFAAIFLIVNATSAEQLLATWPIDLSRAEYIGTGFSNPIDQEYPGSVRIEGPSGSPTVEWGIFPLTGSDTGTTFNANLDDFNTNILTDGTNCSFTVWAGNGTPLDTYVTDTKTNLFGSSPYSLNGIDLAGYTITAISFNLESINSRVYSQLWGPPNNYDYYKTIQVTGTYSFFGYPNLKIHTAVELEWPSVTGIVYQVQWNTNLAANVWHDLGDPILGNGTTNHTFDSTQDYPNRFYRIDVQ